MLYHLVSSHSRPRIAAIFLALLFNAGSPPHVRAAEERSTGEARRLALLHDLIAQRTALARAGNTTALRRCDEQIKSHPAPPNGEAALARHLVGAWRSPRHDTLYQANGSWTLLPVERGDLQGGWHIAGNRLEITSGYHEPFSAERYTIIMVGEQDPVFADRETVFFEKRLPPAGNNRKPSKAAGH